MSNSLKGQVVCGFLLICGVDYNCPTCHCCHICVSSTNVHVDCATKWLQLSSFTFNVELVERKVITRLKKDWNWMLKKGCVLDVIFILELLQFTLVFKVSLYVSRYFRVFDGDVTLNAMLDFFDHLFH